MSHREFVLATSIWVQQLYSCDNHHGRRNRHNPGSTPALQRLKPRWARRGRGINQAFAPQLGFDGIPNSGAGFIALAKQGRLPRNAIQIGQQIRTRSARLQMRLLLWAVGALEIIWQNVFELTAGHYSLSPRFTLRTRSRSAPFGQDIAPCGSSSLGGLFGSVCPEELPHLDPRFVQLRLAVSNRAPDDTRNLVVLVPFYVVKYKDRTITRR